MGHGQSKPERGMELRPGMRPIRRKIEEVKRRRRERKLSIVSTAELLRPEEREEMVEDESTRGAAGTEAGKEDEVSGSPKTVATAATAAEKVKEEKTIDDEGKETAAATAVPEDEVSGSPKTVATVATAAEKVKEEKTIDDEGKETAATTAVPEDEVSGSPKTVATVATAAEKVKEEKTIDDEGKETAAATAVPEKEEEEEKRGLGFKGEEEDDDDDEKGRKLGSSAADEELPGSPSFRFYCTDLAPDSEADSSVKFGGNGRGDKLPEIMEKEKKGPERKNSTDSVNSSEDLEIKPLKKDKGRRLKALTRAPSHVYNLLNVRNCYNNTSSTTCRDRDSLLDGKAAL